MAILYIGGATFNTKVKMSQGSTNANVELMAGYDPKSFVGSHRDGAPLLNKQCTECKMIHFLLS